MIHVFCLEIYFEFSELFLWLLVKNFGQIHFIAGVLGILHLGNDTVIGDLWNQGLSG